MKAGKVKVMFLAVMMALLFSGCNDSVQTEEEIVVPKQEDEAEDTGDQSSQADETQAQDAGGEGIAEQVQAPETYVWEGSNENVSVKVNAPVLVPQGEGFKTYRVTSKTFTQEDYDRVSQTLFQGATLWNRDYEQMEQSNGFTKGEIEERIEHYKENKAAGGKYEETGKNVSYDDLIDEWEAMKENAPEEAIIVDVPALVPYNADTEDSEENWLHGYVTADGQDYFVSVDNNLRDDWRWINFEVSEVNAKSNFMPVGEGEEEEIETDKFPRQSLKEEAEKMIADMGFSDFASAGDEFFRTYAWNEETDALAEDNEDGYGVHFTRTLDGIPVTYTYSDGTGVEDGVPCSWPYEGIDIVFNTEGLASFKWTNPYHIEKLSEETVFLIPFSDIQSIFEEMLLKKYGDFYADSEMQVSFEIDRISLGYMRVMEKGNVMEGTMVPVWDFFGRETVTQGDDEVYTYGGSFDSWLTINALDGTIIDRDLGY